VFRLSLNSLIADGASSAAERPSPDHSVPQGDRAPEARSSSTQTTVPPTTKIMKIMSI